MPGVLDYADLCECGHAKDEHCPDGRCGAVGCGCSIYTYDDEATHVEYGD